MTLQHIIDAIEASPRPLQAKLDALKEAFETQLAPPEVVSIMQRATQALVASRQAETALKAGDRVPQFTLPDSNGEPYSLQHLLNKGPLVLTFYRGIWCPYCNFDLRALEESRLDLESKGAQLVAVSQQTAANSRKSKEANHLGFPILVDTNGDLGHQFGLRWQVPEDLKAVHKQLGADLEIFNGESSWTLPMPARYVIDQDGVIVYSEVNPDYTRRPDPSELLAVLDGLKKVKSRV
ncbi:peroxiredoxin-like family protein [Teredinibacter turnerae]|uniref:peroxiredoxin-like family protein n=1 Tax=Teredinibacter turnerae TaxID=2426 RepID=UPI000361E2BA|nr:peroxiredoxin-like family protein [Teredinibacter turnerae]